MVNPIFEPAENSTTAKNFTPSDKEFPTLRRQPDLNRCSMAENHVSWAGLDDGGNLDNVEFKNQNVKF